MLGHEIHKSCEIKKMVEIQYFLYNIYKFTLNLLKIFLSQFQNFLFEKRLAQVQKIDKH